MRMMIPILAVWLLGCSGAAGDNGHDGVDGAQGANGQDGADGADGADGTDGQDGAPGPAGPAGQDAAASGSRLKARWQFAEDGARSFVGFYDTEKSVPCAFLRAADSILRCLPAYVPTYTLYVDQLCTERAIYTPFKGCPLLPYVLGPAEFTCALEPAYEVYPVGAQIDPATSMFYAFDVSMMCVPTVPPGGFDIYSAGPAVAPSEFVAATIEQDP
jgi:hypothetical protein